MVYTTRKDDCTGHTLCHVGVKGMKWGVRKKRPTTGRKRVVAKPAKAFDGKKKNISKATDDELTSYAKRLELEKRVLTLQKEMNAMTNPPKKVSAGKKFVQSLWNNGLQPGINEGVKSATSKFVGDKLKSLIEKAATRGND